MSEIARNLDFFKVQYSVLYMYIYSTGNLHVPAALEQVNKVTRSFDFLKFLASLFPQCMRVLDGKSRHHNSVSSALNTWFQVYPSSSIL